MDNNISLGCCRILQNKFLRLIMKWVWLPILIFNTNVWAHIKLSILAIWLNVHKTCQNNFYRINLISTKYLVYWNVFVWLKLAKCKSTFKQSNHFFGMPANLLEGAGNLFRSSAIETFLKIILWWIERENLDSNVKI